MNYIDKLLDRTTMYRLLIYYLVALLGVAMVLSAFGYLPYNPLYIALSAGYIVFICWLTNKIFSHVFEGATNPESSIITGLILALIITPPTSIQSVIFLTAAAGLAISSKYILAIRGKHIFNPAAIAVVLTSFGAGESASWWVGSTLLMPVVVIGGIVLIRKVRHTQMVGIFIVGSLITTAIYAAISGSAVITTLQNTLLHSSLFFLAFVMLTEPLTSPTMDKQRRWYALLAAILFPPQVRVLGISSTPELVLVVSNAFSYVVSSKAKLSLKLNSFRQWGSSTIDFVFIPKRRLKYQAGQYMEFTLPHDDPDSRGSRRYFTLASSPTEAALRIGVKFYANGSSFKHELASIDNTKIIAAAQLGGDFVLPKDATRKLAFIAGGIGVTPFRSMTKYLLDTNDQRAVTLFYSEKNANELAYKDVFDAAQEKPNFNIVYTLTDKTTTVPLGMKTGFITNQTIKDELPDFMERLFYISGQQQMVVAMRDMLKEMGVSDSNIKVDFFPGYA